MSARGNPGRRLKAATGRNPGRRLKAATGRNPGRRLKAATGRGVVAGFSQLPECTRAEGKGA